MRAGERGFCSGNCRKSYHRHGGAYRKLRGETRKLVERELIPAIKRETAQLRAELIELRNLWSETESRYVVLQSQFDAFVYARTFHRS